MLHHLKPDHGEAGIPEALAQDGADEFAVDWDQPERLGSNAAQMLWNQLRLADPSPGAKQSATRVLARALGMENEIE